MKIYSLLRKIGIVFSLLMILCVAFFSMISIERHIRVAKQPDLIGDLARFHLRYLRHFDPESKNSSGDSLIHQALYNIFAPASRPEHQQAQFKLAKILLDKGANVNAPDHEGLTLLMSAVNNYNNKAVFSLLELGANPTALGQGFYSNLTALSLAEQQAVRDVDAFSKILQCDPETLEGDEYWQMVLIEFAKRTVGLDVDDCQPLSQEKIIETLAKHANALRHQNIIEAMRSF